LQKRRLYAGGFAPEWFGAGWTVNLHLENGCLEMVKKTTKKKPKSRKVSPQDQELMDFGRDLALAVMLRSLCKTTKELHQMLRNIADLAELEAANEEFLKRQAAT
jgi:predicted secreted protein